MRGRGGKEARERESTNSVKVLLNNRQKIKKCLFPTTSKQKTGENIFPLFIKTVLTFGLLYQEKEMGYEVERKFLVNGDFKSKSFQSLRIKQGYLALSGINVVRVRTKGEKGYLTVKTALEEGKIKRAEWEYEVPVVDAEEMLQMCEDAIIDKVRYLVQVGDHVFEVDEFFGENEGLVLAEVELEEEEEVFEKPDWLGVEVTGNVRYYNSFLSIHPFRGWSED